jgi:hypothetical protein
LIDNSAINIFDFVTLACKYLDKESLISCFKRKLQRSVERGLLDAIPLIGLEAAELPRML